jgi:hypothetical protein
MGDAKAAGGLFAGWTLKYFDKITTDMPSRSALVFLRTFVERQVYDSKPASREPEVHQTA